MTDANIVKNVSTQEPLLKGFGTSLGFSAVITGGFGSLSAAKNCRGIRNAIKQTRLSNEAINGFLEKSAKNTDIFTRNYAAAKNYEAYSSLVKAKNSAQKVVDKIAKNNGKVSLWQRITNLGKSPEDIVKKSKTNLEQASDALESAQTALKSGKEIAKTKVLSNSLAKNTGALFKEELLNPLNLIYAVTSTFSRIKSEAVPVFKEQGVKAGIKQTFASIGKSIADIVSNAGFSAVFRIIGSTAGKIFGPVGSVVGGTIGDIFGTFLSNKFIVKIFGEDNMFGGKNKEVKTNLDAEA